MLLPFVSCDFSMQGDQVDRHQSKIQ